MDDTPFQIDRKDVIDGLGKGLRVIEAFDERHPRLTPSEVATLTNYDPTGCTSLVLVITNQDQHGANPSTAAARGFSVDTA